MTRVYLTILLAAGILLSGCGVSSNSRSASGSLATPEGMSVYLKNLPAVKDARPWQNEYGPGIMITTAHYEIYTTLLEPLMLRQASAFVESAYKAYQDQLPDTIETEIKFVVYLFATRQQWEDFTKTFVGSQWPMYMKIKKGAYYLNGACVTYNIGRSRTFSVLGHEGWHQFNSRHFTYRLPSWLDEGIATLFETYRYEKGFFYFEPDRNVGRLGSLKQTLQRGKMIPLKDLISLNPGQVIKDADSTLAFYAQSYAVVRFLREDGYGKRLSKYHNMLLGALRGNWPLKPGARNIAADRNIPMTAAFNTYVSQQIFPLYIDEDLSLLDEEYRKFCNRIVYHVRMRGGK